MSSAAPLAVEFAGGIEQAWEDVASFVPQFLAFLAILAIGYVVAKALAKVVDSLLERVGFDRAIERGGLAKPLSRSEYDASDIAGKLVFYGLLLIVLQMAFGVFGADNPISQLIAGIIAYLPNVVAAIIIVVIAAAIGSAVKTIVESTLGGLSYGRTLANVAAGLIIAFGVFAALNQLQLAPAIVNGLYFAFLATVAGALIIAFGGGGIPVARQYWERAARRLEEEAPKVKEEAKRQRDEMRPEVDLRDRPAATATASEDGTSAGSAPTAPREPARTANGPASNGGRAPGSRPPGSRG